MSKLGQLTSWDPPIPSTHLTCITTHRRPPTMQSLILIRRRGWSGRIASLPLFGVPFFLPLFFCFLRLAYKSRRRMNRHRSTLIRRVLRQGCAFWGLEYLIFTFFPIFHQKIVKIKPEIGNFMLKHEIQDISEITKPNAVKI